MNINYNPDWILVASIVPAVSAIATASTAFLGRAVSSNISIMAGGLFGFGQTILGLGMEFGLQKCNIGNDCFFGRAVICNLTAGIGIALLFSTTLNVSIPLIATTLIVSMVSRILFGSLLECLLENSIECGMCTLDAGMSSLDGCLDCLT